MREPTTERGIRVNATTVRWRRELRRAITWHRRLLAAGLAAGAVALSISALQPPQPRTVRVLTAAGDLAGGTPLRSGDVSSVHVPPSLAPRGVLRSRSEAVGRTLAAPVRHGEVLTDARLVGPGLLRGRGPGADDLVATPVRLADAEVARLLRPGDRVDVLAADARPESSAESSSARVAARSVQVLAVPQAGDGHGLEMPRVAEGALVVLATSADVAAVLAHAAVTSRLSVTIRGG
jgi:Flp pilus assembly protein CpaB